jgi:hypothetical protein
MKHPESKKKHSSPIALMAIQRTGAGIHGANTPPRSKHLTSVFCKQCKTWTQEDGTCDCVLY